jgi:hypothetical protein
MSSDELIAGTIPRFRVLQSLRAQLYRHRTDCRESAQTLDEDKARPSCDRLPKKLNNPELTLDWASIRSTSIADDRMRVR